MSVGVETFILTCRSGTVPQVVAALERLLVGQPGFLGCWTTELGALNQILILFDRPIDNLDWPGEDLGVQAVAQQCWAPHAGLYPQSGAHGGVYEWRLYDILDGHEADVIALMESALPARAALSSVYAVMTAIGGPSRLLHIWPYADLNERAVKRKQAVESGVWPPKGISALLGTMRSSILIPVAYSPSH